MADYIAGLNAVIGTLLAMYHRDCMKGKPQEVDISLYEGIFRMKEAMVAQYDLFGIARERSPMPSAVRQCRRTDFIHLQHERYL